MTTCRFCNEAHGEGECLSESMRTMPCACRFEWRECPDFSGKPPVLIGACGYHATQLRNFNAELAAQSRELASLRAKVGMLEKEAARYRWLRDSAKEQWLNPRSAASEILPDSRTYWEMPVLMCSGPIGGHISFDAAIDAAIERSKG